MSEAHLLHELVSVAAQLSGSAVAVIHGARSWTYGELDRSVRAFAGGLIALGMQRGERVGIYLEKHFETVVASFSAAAASAVIAPLNPLLKAEQVGFILQDCQVRLLVTSADRSQGLRPMLEDALSMSHLVVVDADDEKARAVPQTNWQALLEAEVGAPHSVIDGDMLAILYTSGGTCSPKGVAPSPRSIVAGAKIGTSYQENAPTDSLLAALPLSFDAGVSPLTTVFHAGARGVLLNNLLPRGQVFLVTDGGLNHRPAASGNFGQVVRKDYPATIGKRLGTPEREKASIVGPRCTPLDILADRMDLPPADADLAVVFQSGAYGASANRQAFLGHSACMEVLV